MTSSEEVDHWRRRLDVMSATRDVADLTDTGVQCRDSVLKAL